MPTFPTLPSGAILDSRKHSAEHEDPALKQEMEGGYTASRARHTRAPRATWSCGYTYITTADRDALLDFYRQMRGGSTHFDWTNPQDSQVYVVRFEGKLKETYVGQGTNQRWDIAFQLVQV